MSHKTIYVKGSSVREYLTLSRMTLLRITDNFICVNPTGFELRYKADVDVDTGQVVALYYSNGDVK